MARISFRYAAPMGDRRHFVDEEDVAVLIGRLPEDLLGRLRVVRFDDESRGGHVAGYTTTRGRREISLCALPPRKSMTKFLRNSQIPELFGAVRGCQWPSTAIRRYMLYNVFLHELGHLQIIDERAPNPRRKYADETKAQGFAEHWCEELWAEPFRDGDLVHNPPSEEELRRVRECWKEAQAEYKKGLAYESDYLGKGFGKQRARDLRSLAFMHYDRAVRLYPDHSLALEALGIITYDTPRETTRAAALLKRALRVDPTLRDANLFLGLALAKQRREPEARRHLDRAIRLSRHSLGIRSVYARVIADWGHVDEARALFDKIMRSKGSRRNGFILFNYERFVKQHDPSALKDSEISRLFTQPGTEMPQDVTSRYHRGLRMVNRYR